MSTVLSSCVCLRCERRFPQPWLNYIFAYCPACRREAGLPTVGPGAARYAPPEVVREQERRLGPMKKLFPCPRK